ncbi:MAG TPA: hypothetical protein VG502_20435 [Flexivirga sp.]|uniref:hypothetical protein n=1 Tax=Flexivirga sp. TaxID=1962927 RepID=UPI002BFBC20D|nr:hypothetical protein [Flexivirga sp.]HWC24671.1 hypothetical protein [Flexivirga sp.]
MRRKIAAALIASALPLVLAGSASAAGTSTTIGQTGPPSTDLGFRANLEFVSSAAAMPADGFVTDFQFESSSCPVNGTFDFQVLRPSSAGYTVIGHTGNQTDPCDSALHNYPVNIPVQQGDVLGVYVVSIWAGILPGGADSQVPYAAIPQPAVGDTFATTWTSSAYLVDEAATFTPLGFQSLIDESRGAGPGTSLADKASNAQAFYNADDTAQACGTLTAYINQVTALKPRISNATNLIQDARDVRNQIGCTV